MSLRCVLAISNHRYITSHTHQAMTIIIIITTPQPVTLLLKLLLVTMITTLVILLHFCRLIWQWVVRQGMLYQRGKLQIILVIMVTIILLPIILATVMIHMLWVSCASKIFSTFLVSFDCFVGFVPSATVAPHRLLAWGVIFLRSNTVTRARQHRSSSRHTS